jgi:hypothetical protein
MLSSLLLAMGITIAVSTEFVRSEIVSEDARTIVLSVVWGIFASVAASFWSMRRSYRRRLATLFHSIADRDLLVFERELTALADAEAHGHYFLADEERSAPDLVRCLQLMRDSCASAASLNWQETSRLAGEARALATSGALSLLRHAEVVECLRMMDDNFDAGSHYSGPRLPPDDLYQVGAVAAAIASQINDPQVSIAPVLLSLGEITALSNAETGSISDDVGRTRACLLDTLVVGVVGTLLQQADVVVRDPDVARLFHLDPSLIASAQEGVLIKVRPLLEARLAQLFGGRSISELIETIASNWSRSNSVVPAALLSVNISLLRDKPPAEYYGAIRTLASAGEYFTDELAIARMNLCRACLKTGELERYRPLIEKCLRDLERMANGFFFSDGIRQLQASYALSLPDQQRALTLLEDLASSATVYAVRYSTLHTLETYYARAQAAADFIRIKATQRSSARLKGFAVLEEAMAAAAQREVMLTQWYFIGLPSKRKYWPFVSTVFSSATT